MVTIRAISMLFLATLMVHCLAVYLEPTELFAGSTSEEEDSEMLSDDFSPLSDSQLAEQLEQMLSDNRFRENVSYEPCLNELVRRGTSQSAAILRKQFKLLVTQEIKQYEGLETSQPGSFYNLELLTALRRAQRQPDPLQIVLGNYGRPITAETLSLPSIKVTITNVDVEKQDVGFTYGGDYRSGRQARWRLHVVDEKGNVVPSRPPLDLIMGGQYQEHLLKYDQAWETELDLHSFIVTPPPGRYQLQVLYHNTKTIADEDDVSRMVVSRSAIVPLIIEPTVILVTDEDNRRARSLIDKISPSEKLKIVVGTYGAWSHDFVAPDSAHGKLLSMGLKAAPQLVELLHRGKLSLRQQACILSVLFSLTGENNRAFTASPWVITNMWRGLGRCSGECPADQSQAAPGFSGIGSSQGGGARPA